ncbi:MAG: hypothetical protein HPY66_1828 [Firmicutes bacterium]|nr:hypothetical protein [Bacillota bacterium]
MPKIQRKVTFKTGNIRLAGTLKEQAYNMIRDAILRGDFPPGKIVSNQKLSQWLGISHTPIREALIELQQNRMVIIHRGKGTEIAPLSGKDVLEIFEMREALEAKTHELAIDRVNNAQLKELEELFDDQIEQFKNKRKIEFLDIDRQFHLLIAKAAQNERIYTAIESLRDQFVFFGNYALSSTNRMSEVIEEHKYILDALKKKDKTDILLAIRRHLKASYGETFKWTSRQGQ